LTQDKAASALWVIDWTLRRTFAVNVHGARLSTKPAIVAIISDPALLRSLAFALEAHGHPVETFSSWRSARERACVALCVVLDGSLVEEDREACLDSIAVDVPVILLADNGTPAPRRDNVLILHKPLAGPDIVLALATLKVSATY